MKNVKITVFPHIPGTCLTKVLVEAQNNKYLVEQDRCRGFSLSVIDKESGLTGGVVQFTSYDGAVWDYKGLSGSWNKREFAEILTDRTNNVLWVREYQELLARQLARECKMA